MLLSKLLVPLSLVAGAFAAAHGNDQVDITSAWPKSNPFAKVENGVSTNLLNLRLANHAGAPVTITGVRGEFRETGGKERLLRKTTLLTLRQPVPSGTKSPIIPYRFFAEGKLGEVGLRVWVDYTDGNGKKVSVIGYDDAVQIVPAPTSWFDLQLLSVYLITGGLLFAIASYFYSLLFSPSSSSSSSSTSRKSRPSPSSAYTPKKNKAVVATSDIIDGGVAEAEKKLDESWIPKHHVKSETGRKRK